MVEEVEFQKILLVFSYLPILLVFRFGLPVPLSASDEEVKKKARLARFAPYSKPDSVEEDKRKARALRYVLTVR